MSASFDRVRPRVDMPVVQRAAGGTEIGDRQAQPDSARHQPVATVIDMAGRAALYSAPLPGPGLGRVAINCPACATRSIVGYWDALWLALPSLHLPIVRGQNSSWMRCPACRHRGWVAVALW